MNVALVGNKIAEYKKRKDFFNRMQLITYFQNDWVQNAFMFYNNCKYKMFLIKSLQILLQQRARGFHCDDDNNAPLFRGVSKDGRVSLSSAVVTDLRCKYESGLQGSRQTQTGSERTNLRPPHQLDQQQQLSTSTGERQQVWSKSNLKIFQNKKYSRCRIMGSLWAKLFLGPMLYPPSPHSCVHLCIKPKIVSHLAWTRSTRPFKTTSARCHPRSSRQRDVGRSALSSTACPSLRRTETEHKIDHS